MNEKKTIYGTYNFSHTGVSLLLMLDSDKDLAN